MSQSSTAHRRSFRRRLMMTAALSWVAFPAFADRVGYSEVFDCEATSDSLIVRHHHDWSRRTREARWQMISTDRDPFAQNNSYAWLQAIDRNGDRQRFRVPVPALRALWISADSRFIVGVSDVKLWNPIQLVVFDDSGRLLLARKVDASTFSNVRESVSNRVEWYREPQPTISIASTTGSRHVVTIEGNDGEPRVFEFPLA
jgi:hypothetical protein